MPSLRRVWKRERHRPLVLVLVGLAVVIALLAIVVWLPPVLFDTTGVEATDKAKSIGDLRTAIVTALGGALLLIGLYFTGRTLQVNREGQITERFTRAIDQLGSRELDIRLGGIYALERIAKDSRADHAPIMEVLTAFLREHTRGIGPRSEPATDHQAVGTVIGRRNVEHEIEGNRVDLILHLEGVNLAGVSLREANLAGASLVGANLERADLYGAEIFFTNLREANLANAVLIKASLVRANLEGANLSGALLIAADLEEAYLYEANLRGADLSGLTNLSGADLNGARANDETRWPSGWDRNRAIGVIFEDEE
jgi:uncharacterized protein YjbI with pentapeptide repeats